MKKTCSKCNIEREITQFDFRKTGNGFYEGICKICRRKRQNAFHKLHPQTSEYNREYSKKYYALMPKDWRRDYVKRRREKLSKQYNVPVSAIVHHGLKVAIMVFEKFNRKCNKCGSAERLCIHHIDRKGRNFTNKGLIPNNKIDNLELLCICCHGSIHGKQNKGIKHKKRKL